VLINVGGMEKTMSDKPTSKPAKDPDDKGSGDTVQALDEGGLFSAFDVMNELVLVRSDCGRVQYVNRAFLKAFGGERADWIDRWFSVAPPRSADRGRQYDVLMRTSAGAIWIEWNESVLPDDGGVVSVGRDVTWRREAHENMAASQKAKSMFFAAVTHELRTPLAGALGIARLLDDTPLRPDQTDYVRSLTSSTQHALALIDDILDLSKLEAGKLALRPQDVDIAELVRETVELVATRAWDKGLEIGVVHAAGAPSLIRGDAARIKQIIYNLLGNAVKFTQSGGVRLEIANSPASDGRDRLSLSISDTGPGISEADQETLFESFERGAAEREGVEEGAGLGLSMVRRLVQAMDSAIGIESQLGRGSNFWVTFELPVLEVRRDTPLAGRSLAVASDNEVLRTTLADQMRALGADVVAIDTRSRLIAASGRELLLDTHWAASAQSASAIHTWLLVNPGDKNALIADLPDAIQGWMVKPVRRTTLIDQITGRVLGRREPKLELPDTSKAEPRDWAAERPLEGMTVLVAEDEPVNALIARRTLEALGADVRAAETGTGALQALEDGGLDAALIDQRMPGMDGPSVARMARMAGVEIPLVALTANSGQADRQLCIDAGMNDFLSKPVDPETLANTLIALCHTQKRASMG
jgi:signal transduction histidine kinase/CheY-like chemotaxis protein